VRDLAQPLLPASTSEGQDAPPFKPPSYTKNFSIAIAALLAITLDPAIRLLFTPMDPYNFRPRFMAKMVNAALVGKIHSEENHPISRPLMKLYHPVCEFVLRFKWLVVVAAGLAMSLSGSDLHPLRLGI